MDEVIVIPPRGPATAAEPYVCSVYHFYRDLVSVLRSKTVASHKL